MTRSELIELLQTKFPDQDLTDIEQAVRLTFQCMIDALKRGERVEIRGFGHFELKIRNKGPARNPKTGEIIMVDEKVRVHFGAGNRLSAILNPDN